MKTIKLPYKNSTISSDRLFELLQIQANIVHIAYNRFMENYSEKDIRIYLKNMNNINIGSWLEQSAIKKASYLYKKDKNAKIVSCFGGKPLFKKLSQKKISKDEWKRKKLFPLMSIGEQLQKGNRLFRLNFENRKIYFNLDRKNKFEIDINWNYHKNYLHELNVIDKLAKENKISVTFGLDFEYVYITFDESKIYVPDNYLKKENRVFGIDMNPNYIGWNISEFNKNEKQNILTTGIYVIKNLTKKLNVKSSDSKQKWQDDKRKYELIEIAKDISKKAKLYNCNKLIIEDLNIKHTNQNQGKNRNRLCNNKWNRTEFITALKKQCYLYNIELVEVNPAYSSFIGNLIYSKYPDMVAASCEISRRGYFKYIKGKFYPDLITNENISNRWKDAKYWMYSNWIELYDIIKKSKLKYRIPLDNNLKSYRFKTYKSLVYII